MTRDEFEKAFDKYYATAIINNISIYYDEYTIEFEDGEEIVNFFNEGGYSLICSIPLKDVDLVISQQVKIERLKASVNVVLENYASEYDSKIKAEAIKEFAERLKNLIRFSNQPDRYYIDCLVKEMVGEDK